MNTLEYLDDLYMTIDKETDSIWSKVTVSFHTTATDVKEVMRLAARLILEQSQVVGTQSVESLFDAMKVQP